MVKPGFSTLTVLGHELKLGRNHVPILTEGVSVLDNFIAGQIEHFSQRVVISKTGLVLDDLPQPAV